MICSKVLSGIASDCSGNVGGVKKVWVASPSGAVTFTETDGKISAINIASSTVADEFKYFYFRKNTASATSTYTLDAANGVSFVTTDLSLVFGRMNTAKRIEMEALALGDLYVVYEDANGSMWALGVDSPVNASAGSGETGVNSTDRNAYAITLQDISNGLPKELTSELAETFRAIV